MISTKTALKKEIQELILPSNYSVDLAEETGIHIGDGCMNIYSSNNGGVYTYSGHAIDDFDFSVYVKHLIKKLYNLYPSYERVKKNTILLAYTRNELIRFKCKLGLPLGPKKDVKIPKWIILRRDYKIACVRGIFATDGCLIFQKKHKNINYYPKLSISSKSEILINQINTIFNELGIKSSVSYDGRITTRHPNKIWLVYLYGVKNLKKFVEIIGFCNPKQSRKYEEWKNSVGGGL